MKKRLMALLAGLPLAFGSMSVQAIPMLELSDGASIVVGDKIFSDWQILLNNVRDGGGNIVGSADLSNIDVQGLDDDPLNLGLVYDANGELFVSTVDRAFQDLTFDFVVSTIDGSVRIEDNSLTIPETGFVIDSDSFTFVVSEDVSSLGGDPLGAKELDLDIGRDVLSTSINFAPQSSIRVRTRIRLDTDDGELVQLESFEQRFSQIPEPTTLALLGIGLSGMGFGRKRMKAA
jgi:hypothetical protein